jgi:phenylacetaldehyde dehydrogenase
VVTALITLNGQWCRALGRLLVASAVYDELLERIAVRLSRIRIGDSRSSDSEMGPLVSRTHHARVAHAVHRLVGLGGRVIAPLRLPASRGAFHAPILIDGCAAEHCTGEIFGPVATVHRFDGDDEAVALANNTPFGLQGYVFSGHAGRALRLARRVRTGSVKVNGVTLFGLHPQAPRPAWGLSGLVDEGTRHTLEHFRGSRVVGFAGSSAR